MDADVLLSGTKWDMIELLAKEEQSPSELATKLHTSNANVSMQLRLLEVANLIRRERTGSVEKRIIYSLARDICFVHLATPHLQFKKQISLDRDKEFIFKIWQLPTPVQGPFIQFYYNNKFLFTPHYDVYFGDYGDGIAKIYVSNERKSLPAKIITVDYEDKKFVLDVEFVTESRLKLKKKLTLLHKGRKD